MAAMKMPGLVLPPGKQTWLVRVRVPASLVKLIGKAVLSRSTGQQDPAKAMVVGRKIREEFRGIIAKARKGATSGPQAPEMEAVEVGIRAHADTYRTMHAADPELAEMHALEDGLLFIEEHIVGASVSVDRTMRTPREAFQAILDRIVSRRAVAAYDTITGASTPFLVAEEAWAGTSPLMPRQLDQYRADLKLFDGAVKADLQEIDRRKVQVWVEDRIGKHGDSPKTLVRRVSALKNYWGYLQSHQYVEEDNTPFAKPRIPKAPSSGVRRT